MDDITVGDAQEMTIDNQNKVIHYKGKFLEKVDGHLMCFEVKGFDKGISDVEVLFVKEDEPIEYNPSAEEPQVVIIIGNGEGFTNELVVNYTDSNGETQSLNYRLDTNI